MGGSQTLKTMSEAAAHSGAQGAAEEDGTFFFTDPNRPGQSAWLRYKLKECWTLVLSLVRLRGQEGPVVLHNWWGGRALGFSHEFLESRAALADPRLAGAGLVEAQAGSGKARLWALVPAAFLMLLPVAWLVGLARLALPRGLGPLVVYCDGHLSGFVLVRAARGRGIATATLHHGLYRADDPGSIMGIRNFTADRIYLWDACTEESFRMAGTDPARLFRTGQYGFGALTPDGAQDPDCVILCPPYDARWLGLFDRLAGLLPGRTLWSLHPLLREAHADRDQAPVATASPRPGLAICGDSGAVMDALARGLPTITVAERPLTRAHLTPAEADGIDAPALTALATEARAALAEDRERFGFDDTAPPVREAS